MKPHDKHSIKQKAKARPVLITPKMTLYPFALMIWKCQDIHVLLLFFYLSLSLLIDLHIPLSLLLVGNKALLCVQYVNDT